jgi:para-nitrobenzyl esterase
MTPSQISRVCTRLAVAGLTPYAAPPVGALRWQPPQPAASWPGVRAATQFGPHCPQLAGPFGEASTSENCLYLNVFTPAAGADHPVMVWIHGGALVSGESNDYDPTALVEHGVTVVTINYRLGALGFLAHPALADASGQSGDYGLMDQQAALRWVQRNIANFGGDPRNVTVFGESAGGLSTLSQVASPQAKGLFEKAIVESGSYNLTQASLASAETAGEAFATKAGCASQTAACLRRLPVSVILADQDASGYTPNINTEILPQSLGTAFATGNFNRVPIINGTNHDEWRLFVALSALAGNPVTPANYQAMIASTLDVPATAAAVIAAKYPLTAYPSPSRASCRPSLMSSTTRTRPRTSCPRSASPTAPRMRPRSSTCSRSRPPAATGARARTSSGSVRWGRETNTVRTPRSASSR